VTRHQDVDEPMVPNIWRGVLTDPNASVEDADDYILRIGGDSWPVTVRQASAGRTPGGQEGEILQAPPHAG